MRSFAPPILSLIMLGCGSSTDVESTPADAASSETEADAAIDTGVASDTAKSDTASETPASAMLARSAGGRDYKLFVPSGASTASPLVVMLHGCDQNPDDFALGTRMNAFAEKHKLLVAYPLQPTTAQPVGCWRWYEPAHQARGAGEPASIVGVVDDVKSHFSVDDKRVYVAGISAGAAMSVILGATYPDVFAAIAVHSGLEYAAATSTSASYKVLASGGPDPNTQGDAAWTAMGPRARVVPVMVVHGDADGVVAPKNGTQVVSQWIRTDDRAGDGLANGTISTTAASSTPGATFDHATWTEGGKVVIEQYVVHGLAHAWSGGDPAGSYTAAGPDASQWIVDFFRAH